MTYNFTQFKNRVAEIEQWLHKEFGAIRTGRATPTLLDGVQVESYGSLMPLAHVASISIEDPKTLRISPWDKGQLKGIESALRASNLGVSIVVDGEGVRAIFPELTQDSRKNFVKVAGQKLEEARVSLRKERERAWNDVAEKEKNGEMSEDDKFRAKEELQKHVDAANVALDAVMAKKEKEILEG